MTKPSGLASKSEGTFDFEFEFGFGFEFRSDVCSERTLGVTSPFGDMSP